MQWMVEVSSGWRRPRPDGTQDERLRSTGWRLPALVSLHYWTMTTTFPRET